MVGQLHIPDHLFLLKETLEPTEKNGHKKSVFIGSNSSQNNMQVTGQPLTIQRETKKLSYVFSK